MIRKVHNGILFKDNMPRIRRECKDAKGGEQQCPLLVDKSIFHLDRSDILVTTPDSTGGERKLVFYWRPPMRYLSGANEVVGGRGILRQLCRVRLQLINNSDQDMEYALCVPSEDRRGEPLVSQEMDGTLGSPLANNVAHPTLDVDIDMAVLQHRGQRLRSTRIQLEAERGLGEIHAELIRVLELQLECSAPEVLGSQPVEVRVQVEYESNGAKPKIDPELCLYKERIEAGKPLGRLETTEVSGRALMPTLGTLPDEGYPQIGLGWEISNGYTIPKLCWYRAGVQAADFRWRNVEDGDTRISIPSLVLTEVNNENHNSYVTVGNLEWGFDYNKGLWALVQPDSSDGLWSVYGVSGWRMCVSSRVPVVTYDRRPPNRNTLSSRGFGQVVFYEAETTLKKD